MAIAAIFCLILAHPRSAMSEWRGDVRVNIENTGKQASRGADCPWSISVDKNDRVHVVWEDRRLGHPLRIYYRGKDPDPTWMGWDQHDYELSTIDSVELFGHPSIYPQADGKLFAVYVEEKIQGGELYGSWITDHPSLQLESGMVSDSGGNRLAFTSTGWQTTIAVSGNRTITFWPYSNPGISGSLPIYYKIFDGGIQVGDEQPIALPEAGMAYAGVNLSAFAGSHNRVYLVSRVITEEYPGGRIYLFTVDIMSGRLISVENLTPGETRACRFPYISVKPRENGDDLIAVTYEINSPNSKAVFIYNNSGEWSDPMVLSTGEKTSGHPCLAINGKYAELVYESPDNTPNGQIYHQRYDFSTGVLTDAVRVTHSDIYFNHRPVIAADSYGNLHLIYITNRENPDVPGDEEVYYSIYDAPPSSPAGVRFNRAAARISWNANPEPDIDHYEVELNGELSNVSGVSVYIESPVTDDFIIAITAADLSGQKSIPVVYRSTKRGLREISAIPDRLFVGYNYPNPFNGSTRIPVSLLNINAPSYLEILDITGRVVRTLNISSINSREVSWNGTNDYGCWVSSGTYLYRLRSGRECSKSRIMTLLK